VGLEQGPLSLVSTTEELLGRKNIGSGLESRDYGRRDPSSWPRDTFYPRLTSPTSACPSVGIVRSRTQATGFFFSKMLVHQTVFSKHVVTCRDDHIACSEILLKQAVVVLRWQDAIGSIQTFDEYLERY
jgi:hypothetical protein